MRFPFKADIEMFNPYALKNSSPPQSLEADTKIFDVRFSVFRNASSNKRIFDESFSVLDNSLLQSSTQDKKSFRKVKFNENICVINEVKSHKLEAGVSLEKSNDSFRSSRVSRRIDFEGYGNNEVSTDDKSNQLLPIAQEKHPKSRESKTNLNKRQSEPFERYFDPENLKTSINTIANAISGSPANISDDEIRDFATIYVDYLNEKFLKNNTKLRGNEVNKKSDSLRKVPKDPRAISHSPANISDDERKGSEKTYLEYLKEKFLKNDNALRANEVNKKSVSLQEEVPNDSRLIPFRIEGGKIYPEFGDKNSVVQPLPVEASSVEASSTYSYFLPSIRSSSLPDNSDNFSSSRSKSNRSTVRDEDAISQNIMMVKTSDANEDVLPAPLPESEAISALPPKSEPKSEITSALPPKSEPESEITSALAPKSEPESEIISKPLSQTLQATSKPNQSLKGVANINYSIENNFLVFNIRAIKDKPLFYTENKSYLNKISSFFWRCFRDDISHDSVLEKDLTKGLVKDYGFIAIAKKEDEELIKSFISELGDSKAVFTNWQNQDDPNNLYSKIHKLESGFENNPNFREKIVKLLELGLNIKHECSKNADLDKLIEAIYKNNNIPDNSRLKDREIGEVVKFANYLLKNNSNHDLNEEKINQVKARTLKYANHLDKINSAPIFTRSIESGRSAQTKITEEQIPINLAYDNSRMGRPLVTLGPSPIIKPQPNQGVTMPLSGVTGSETQHGQS